ncbi:hypothetical protein [uncultured Parabacteroides sp.]|uniref:hypothetical protein n=1 Tax=uncultured Parabacteroides sp. TaxID=512312 RepID=UPI0025FD80CE|nr:hypothetical protein [uncultured Parabacteroides sp.]
MRTQKFSHMTGGKVLETILIILAITLFVLFLILLFANALNIISMLLLLVSVMSVLWFTYKSYKPTFTDVIFSDEGIISKTHFEQEELPIDTIKGIWYYKNRHETEIKPYSDKDKLKNCIIIIGDIDCFTDVEYIGFNGSTTLRDSFKKGYTTLVYRKRLDGVLKEYDYKIRHNALHNKQDLHFG